MEEIKTAISMRNNRLNPYSNGMLTWPLSVVYANGVKSLNPYSNGMLTWKNVRITAFFVLGLNPYSNGMLTWSI